MHGLHAAAHFAVAEVAGTCCSCFIHWPDAGRCSDHLTQPLLPGTRDRPVMYCTLYVAELCTGSVLSFLHGALALAPESIDRTA